MDLEKAGHGGKLKVSILTSTGCQKKKEKLNWKMYFPQKEKEWNPWIPFRGIVTRTKKNVDL